MVDPLVEDPQRSPLAVNRRQTVLRKNVEAERRDHLGDAVIDLRVDVVGAPREHQPALPGFRHPVEQFPALFADIGFRFSLFRPRGSDGGADLVRRDIPRFAADLRESLRDVGFALEGQEGVQIADLARHHVLHIVLDVLGVRDHHRAVVAVLRVFVLAVFVENGGVEDRRDPLADQPLDMPVRELRGIALGFRRYRLHTELIDLPARVGREDHAEAEFFEEGRPERIVLVEVQDARDADRPARRVGFGEGFVAEEPLALVGVEVLAALRSSRRRDLFLAAVAGDIPPSAREGVDRQQTVVLAAAAAGGRAGVGQVADLLEREDRRRTSVVVFTRDERRAERPHHPGDIGADHVDPGDLLERTENGVVVEGAALRDDVPSERTRVGQANDLVERVFDDRIRKPRRDVGNRCALLLRLLDLRVHEDGAARAEVDRRLRGDRLAGELLRRKSERFGEVLDERTAPRRARLVQHNAVDRSAL